MIGKSSSVHSFILEVRLLNHSYPGRFRRFGRSVRLDRLLLSKVRKFLENVDSQKMKSVHEQNYGAEMLNLDAIARELSNLNFLY